MLIDLHNHTTLCNHATGEPEAYVEAAIRQHIDIFGFSDHAPMDFDEEYRMPLAQMKEYETYIHSLQESYQDSIRILLGYEVDYLPGHIYPDVLNADVDYLIGSVHFIGTWGFDNPEFMSGYANRDMDETWRTYFGLIADMADSGLFQIVGHMDLLKIFNFMPSIKSSELAVNALEKIKKAGMAIEINSAGLRKQVHENYPSEDILKKICALDIPITFGSDAHTVHDVGFSLSDNMTRAKELGFHECVYFEKRVMRRVPL